MDWFQEQFMAVYLSSAVLTSLASYVYKVNIILYIKILFKVVCQIGRLVRCISQGYENKI